MYNSTNRWQISKKQLLFSLVICFFILCEYCSPFYWLDGTHLKHVFFIAIVFLYGVNLLKDYENILMRDEIKHVLITAMILYGISVFFQIYHMQFKLYSVAEVYYLIMPAIFGVIVFNYCRDDIDFIMTAILATCFFSFVITRIDRGTLTIENLKSMISIQSLFIESVSAMIESDLSNFFLLLFVYFAFRKHKWRCILSGIGVFLGYKRFAVLYLVILIIILRFVPRDKRVNNKIIFAVIAAFCLAPFAVYYMCTDSFANWFYHQFGIDFNQFTMTRFYIINTVIDADLPCYGLGTVTNYLETRGVAGQTNMHNDILRIYMECTIIGTVAFTFNYFKMSEKCWYSFLTMLFIFMELFVAHFLGPAATSFWTVAYLAIFTFNKKYDETRERGEELNESIV